MRPHPHNIPPQHTGQTATWDEASKCFYCKREMSIARQQRPAMNLTATVLVLVCQYEDCPYYQQTAKNRRAALGNPNERGDQWVKIVERLADGTIPVRLVGPRAREFQRMPRVSQESKTAFIERMEAEIERTRVDRARGKHGGLYDPRTGQTYEAPEE